MSFEFQSDQGFEVLTFPVGALQCNCSLLWDTQSKEAILIDPGDEADRILREIRTRDLKMKGIIHTHAHFDHIGAASVLHESTRAPLYLHSGDTFLWENLPTQGQMFGFQLKAIPRWNQDLEDGLELCFGMHKLRTLFTPGHTPGSCCFSINDLLFSGDTLFYRSIGRTDFWGGDSTLIQKSIRDRLYRLDKDTRVICGHGPNTLIGHEMKSNPFVQA